MKIPLDFFLRLIEKFLSEQEFDNVIKKLKKHYETPEEDFSDILSDLSLQDIISKYVKDNKELKKKLKAKSKKFLEENKINEENEKEEKEEKEQLTTKKRKRTMSGTKEEEKEEKPKKKRKRTMSSTKEEKDENEEKKEKKEKSKRKRTMSSTKEENDEKEKEKEKEGSSKKRKKTEENNEEDEKEAKKEKKKKKKKDDDEDIDLEKEVQYIPKPKSDSNPNRVPFKRIDESNVNYQVPKNLRDNSYAAFMKQTGDDFGKAANDKLIVTRGKGFRKEKTKFKNKTFHGGMTISTSVRSIPLEDDSSSDENK